MSPSLFSIISAKQKFFWYYYAYSLSLWILNEEICRCKRKVVNLPWLLENEYEKEIVSSFLLLQCLNIDILRNLVDMEKILFILELYITTGCIYSISQFDFYDLKHLKIDTVILKPVTKQNHEWYFLLYLTLRV